VDDGLLSFTPDQPYPIHVAVSPLLARVEGDPEPNTTAQLLAKRSRQVFHLTLEKSRLEARLQELEQHVFNPSSDSPLEPGNNWPARRGSVTLLDVRNVIARLFLEGDGLEIGALHSPVKVEWPARVRYVDRMTAAQLRQHYPELDDHILVEPDIIDDGERLETIPDESQDFVIANHFLEHCQDTIGAIKTLFRVLKPGGILYIAVPDKRFTFDRKRPPTPFEHLVRDHEDGPAWSRTAHYQEWAELADDENTLGRTAQELMDRDYSIHFHVWTQSELFELLARLQTDYGVQCSVELTLMNQIEVLFILRKAPKSDAA
jgi:SAM-dependent methyltransferase